MVFPGISLFVGGLVRRKNIISIYAQCVVIAAAAILSWVTISYSLAFSPTGGAFIGDLSRVGLTGITPESLFPAGALLFGLLWAALEYASVAPWVWHSDGWWAKMGHIDWAGGTVVHVAAGFLGLAATIVAGRRIGYG